MQQRSNSLISQCLLLQRRVSSVRSDCLRVDCWDITVQQRAKCKLHYDSRDYHSLSLALFSSSLPESSLHLVFCTSHTQTFTHQASYGCDFTSCLTSAKVRLKMFHASPSVELIYSEVNLLCSHGKFSLFQHGQFNVHSWRGWGLNWTYLFSILEDHRFQQTKEHVMDGKSQGD